MTSAPIRASAVLLCAVFSLCLYRAATQSLTIDEAFTFLHYVDTPWRDVFGEYSANNHVLFSLVSRVFRHKFGQSEIVLRIPALIGCLLFLLASFRISRAAVGEGWLLPLTLAVLTLNPLVLDFMAAARGYGLGLGLFWWALYLVWRERLWVAGVLAGLSIAANLIYVIPLAALGAAAIPLYVRRRRFWDLIYSYALAAILVAFTILVIPVSKGAGQFYYGASSLADTVSSLVNDSLPADSILIARVVAPAAFFIAMPLGAWLLWRHNSPQSELLAIVLTIIGFAVLCWVTMHRLLGFVYPLNRTAIYMLPLVGLAVALGGALTPKRWVSIPLIALAAVLATLYIAQIRTGYFKEWRDQAGMNRLMRHLKDDAAGLARARQITAGGTWNLEYSMRYYGKRHRIPWLKVLDATERETVRPDYYILTRDEAKKAHELNLKVIDTDVLSGTILARSY
ncbi:MAG TPA: hypothetical protein VER03_15520 [Bryobacteraceae bacterium]|nr:hypothetical protein [Bryobacteraceae bacterium]